MLTVICFDDHHEYDLKKNPKRPPPQIQSVSDDGAICVNTLKRDWSPDHGIKVYFVEEFTLDSIDIWL